MRPLAAAGQTPMVLAVQAETLACIRLRQALHGIARVVEAPSGKRALLILEQRVSDLLNVMLVDHSLPDVTGLELLHITRRRWPEIAVVLMTEGGSEELAIQAFRAGARDYLRKPVDGRELRRVVVPHLRRTRPNAFGPNGPAPEPARTESHEPGAVHLAIVRARAFVHAHFAEPLTLAQVAGEIGLSKFHLCRLFRQQVGRSFREYLRGLRIDRACMLLADPRLTITEVAYTSGFNDLAHFDRLFARIVGVCPTAFRRTLRSAAAATPHGAGTTATTQP